MKSINVKDLDKIKGGSISGSIISAVESIIEVLKNAGYALGSGIRRIAEDNLCPLK